ncbi:MipA/OmpV family protein [Pseudomaricurvus alcaniphilus]|uniref:MipA/OmpV family protein n=1 Tax=Pseudomaricurvus alcaniphilus TaxID=1166482 RepID=UPI0014080C8A|nr:MipA/OmpV family protein [Pseudomaricurvus alcaniphilus]
MLLLSPVLNAEPQQASDPASEEGEPLWQLGLGAGAVRVPYYPGASESDNFAFPVVFPVYRGEFLKADEDGVRGELFANRRWQLQVSLDFNFSIDSDEVDVREGMPDLPATLQIGPLLKYHAYQSDDLNLWLQLPIRAVVGGEDLDIDYEGYQINPRLVLEKPLASAWGRWRWTHHLGPVYGSEKYHRFYFGVAPQFATIDRPTYEASSGYGGVRYQMSLTKLDEKHLFSVFLRYDDVSAASFRDSPLVTEDHTFAVGFVYSYFVLNSKARVVRGKAGRNER